MSIITPQVQVLLVVLQSVIQIGPFRPKMLYHLPSLFLYIYIQMLLPLCPHRDSPLIVLLAHW